MKQILKFANNSEKSNRKGIEGSSATMYLTPLLVKIELTTLSCRKHISSSNYLPLNRKLNLKCLQRFHKGSNSNLDILCKNRPNSMKSVSSLYFINFVYLELKFVSYLASSFEILLKKKSFLTKLNPFKCFKCNFSVHDGVRIFVEKKIYKFAKLLQNMCLFTLLLLYSLEIIFSHFFVYSTINDVFT